LTSPFFLMVKAHLKQFNESRNSFTCSSILPTSFFFLLLFPDQLSQEGSVQKPIFSFGVNGWLSAWKAAVHGVAEGRTQLSDFTFTFHFHALEKEKATHSSVLAWRIPGMGEPGGLPSMGSHRVGHNWSDLAAAAVHWFKCSGLS